MMKKNIIFLLLGLFALVSCEKEVNEDGNDLMYIEQYTPVLDNGTMKLSGKVSLSSEFKRETAKVGFLVKEYTKEMEFFADNDIFLNGYTSSPYDAYQDLVSGGKYGDSSDYLWVDEIGMDGSFSVSFVPQQKQYICIAFAINVLDENEDSYDSKYQILSTKPYFFTGDATAHLELIHPIMHEFELTFSYDDDIEVGLCWSDTNPLPNIEDASERIWFETPSEKGSVISVKFHGLDFGDSERIYLRGYTQKRLTEYASNGESYKMVYSNVIEFYPKDLEIDINSKKDLQDFINSMYVRLDSVNNAYDDRRYEIWNTFYGKININYEAQKIDWLDNRGSNEYGDSVYFDIPIVNCTITGIGKGVIPHINSISESGKISGMALLSCYDNYGLLENVSNSVVNTNRGTVKGGNQNSFSNNYGTISGNTYVSVESNYGELLDSENIYVNSNYGLVRDCKDVYGIRVNSDGWVDEWNRMVYSNYGYIENCLPDSICCENNYGIIKN